MTKFNPLTRSRLLVDAEFDVDLSSATVAVEIAGAWHSATWTTPAVKRTTQVSGRPVERWYRTARTTDYFAGPEHAAPAGATVLPIGRYMNLKTKVVVDGDELVNLSPTAIDVG